MSERMSFESEQLQESTGDDSWAEQAKNVPHQAQQILIAWVFIWASIFLFLDFAALQGLVNGHFDSYFVKLCNWFGVASCVLWFQGFVILQHWLARVGATSMGQSGCFLKLIAAVFFNLQPMTGTANDLSTRGGAGLWWSNLLGILLFHSGNLVSCADFYLHTPPGADKKKGWLYFGNLPITGMWIYQLATWLLVYANLFSCAWGGGVPSKQFVETSHWSIAWTQYLGSGLLAAGSCVYCLWCNGFRTFAAVM